MSEWKKVKIKDLASRIVSGGTPLTKHTEYYNGHIPWLNTKEVKNCRILETAKFITELGLNNSSAKLIDSNSVIVAMYGVTAGKVAINKIELTTNQACCNITLNEKIADYNFIYYLLLSSFERLDRLTSGAAQQNLNVGLISNLEVLVPDLIEQKVIANVLSDIDDKIDLLHHQNRTFEKLAQTLFRQWFIENSEDDWEEYEIRDFAMHKKISIKPSENPDNNFSHFSLPAFDTNKEPNIELGSDIKSNKYQVEPFSILMSKLNPVTPRVWDIYFEPKENSICSTEFQVVQPDDRELFPFISTLLKSDKVRGELSMSSSGTSGSHQRVKPEDIFNISFLTPSVDKMKEFSQILEPNYLKQRKNQQQIKTLENMRDTLLPKLMSGEVKVKI